MKKQSYSDLLKDPRWQKKRLEIFKRDKWKCKLCNDNKTQLHVHHKEYINDKSPWEYENKYLITLCEDCHQEIERIKKESPDIDINKIDIYKSSGWTDDSTILFVMYNSNLSLRIYDQNKEFITGYNFGHYILNDIRRFLSKHIK
jgi:hypothetical protein